MKINWKNPISLKRLNSILEKKGILDNIIDILVCEDPENIESKCEELTAYKIAGTIRSGIGILLSEPRTEEMPECYIGDIVHYAEIKKGHMPIIIQIYAGMIERGSPKTEEIQIRRGMTLDEAEEISEYILDELEPLSEKIEVGK